MGGAKEMMTVTPTNVSGEAKLKTVVIASRLLTPDVVLHYLLIRRQELLPDQSQQRCHYQQCSLTHLLRVEVGAGLVCDFLLVPW